MGNTNRPNSFYDSRTINTLGGASMALFVIATILRYFLLNEGNEYKQIIWTCINETSKKEIIVHNWGTTKPIFFSIVFILAFSLAVIRQFANEADKEKEEEEKEEKEKQKKLQATTITKTEEIEAADSKNPPSDVKVEIVKSGFDLKEMLTGIKKILSFFAFDVLVFRNLILIVINSFLIVASASGVSAISGDSWFRSKTDNALLNDKQKKIEEQERIIHKYTSPQRVIADSLERAGIEAILSADFTEAKKHFKKCDSVYPTFHCAYELGKLLTKYEQKPDSQSSVIEEVLNKYNYGLPKDLVDALKQKQEVLSTN